LKAATAEKMSKAHSKNQEAESKKKKAEADDPVLKKRNDCLLEVQLFQPSEAKYARFLCG
jgi:hypothetical protein